MVPIVPQSALIVSAANKCFGQALKEISASAEEVQKNYYYYYYW